MIEGARGSSMEIDFSKNADRIVKDLRRNETISMVIGALVVLGAEMFHTCCMPGIQVWKVRGLFIPLICVVSLLAMWSSIGMQNSLKERGAPHAIESRMQCIQFLIDANDVEGMRLLKGVGIASNFHCAVFGIIAGICVASFVSP